MRQTISGLVAAVAVVAASAAPAMACGLKSACGRAMCRRRSIRAATAAAAAGYERLPDPVQQYHAAGIRCSSIITSIRARPIPVPAISRPIRSIGKTRVSGWRGYHHRHHYYGYHHPYYHHWHAHHGFYGYHGHITASRYGYAHASRIAMAMAIASTCCAATTDRHYPIEFGARSHPASGRFVSSRECLSPSGQAGWRRYRAPAPRRWRR